MSDLSHIDPEGRARMVDVSAKDVTVRMARATGAIQMRRRRSRRSARTLSRKAMC